MDKLNPDARVAQPAGHGLESSLLPGRIADMPRLNLANLPTPLDDAPHLSAALDGPRILFKRDDLTGVGLGGNKVRKLEFLIARALHEGADTLVASGGFQSNLARIAVAMANRVGMSTELVLGGVPGEPRPIVGNLLLDSLLGANLTFVDTQPRWDFGDSIARVADAVRARGGHPYVVPLGGSSAEGIASYVCATLELKQQLAALEIEPQHLIVGVGSGGTHVGLLLGQMNLQTSYRVTGISVSRARDYLLSKIPEVAREAAADLDLHRVPQGQDVVVHDDYIGDSYGALTAGCTEAIRLVARTEGLILDPVYSGKAMAGLIGLIRKGFITRGETVVFLHTGGQPALFAYQPRELLAT
ncbi:MAG TPA: D-cysteine desulfhydrase family protein [Steroidobacteraceae bacterium]